MPISHEDFGDTESQKAVKLIDLYEGRQLGYAIRNLDGYESGGWGKRSDWLKRGIVPHVRNIIKPIVEKSALLFNKPAKYEILPENSTAKPVIDPKFNQILVEADWSEFVRNLDIYTRLLKTVIVLQQKNIEDAENRQTVNGAYVFDASKGDAMVPVMLHRGNSVVVMNKARTKILELAYLSKGNPVDAEWEYTYITPSTVDVVTIKAGKEVSRVSETNVDQVVPASIFYDTGRPRAGIWHKIPEDLPSFQDFYNTHLTDLAFALAVGKANNLIISNAVIAKGTNLTPNSAGRVQETVDAPQGGNKTFGSDDSSPLGGIGAIINLMPGKNATIPPTADYKGPNVDLSAHDAVVRSLIKDLASDWSVNLKTADSGSATSGFQLLVEEIDNLQLREQRAQSFQSALRRFYEVTLKLYPELTQGSLQVIFADAGLPVNQDEQIDIWTKKITAGLASPIDYYEQVEGLSEAEAIKRATDVMSYNKLLRPQPEVTEVTNINNSVQDDEAKMT